MAHSLKEIKSDNAVLKLEYENMKANKKQKKLLKFSLDSVFRESQKLEHQAETTFGKFKESEKKLTECNQSLNQMVATR